MKLDSRETVELLRQASIWRSATRSLATCEAYVVSPKDPFKDSAHPSQSSLSGGSTTFRCTVELWKDKGLSETLPASDSLELRSFILLLFTEH